MSWLQTITLAFISSSVSACSVQSTDGGRFHLNGTMGFCRDRTRIIELEVSTHQHFILDTYLTTCEGELELSFFTTFCRAANFKAFMVSAPVVGLLGRMRSLFLSFFPSARNGTLASDISALENQLNGVDDAFVGDDRDGTLVDVPNLHYQAVIDRINCDIDESVQDRLHPHGSDHSPDHNTAQRQAAYCSHFTRGGFKYTTFKRSLGDSMVVFRTSDGKGNRMGRIREIFVHVRPGPSGKLVEEHFVVIDGFRELDREERELYDPYHHYPFLGIRLCHDELEGAPIVAKASDIICHFASCTYRNIEAPKFRVTVSLSRVSSSLVLIIMREQLSLIDF